jgi:hypothetical protein
MKIKIIKKKQRVKEKEDEFNLIFLLFCFLIYFSLDNARSAEIGAGYSQSSTGSIQKNYNLSFGITEKLSISLYSADSLQKNDDTSLDNKAASYKGSLIYKPAPTIRYAIAYKKINDYNEYVGESYSGKFSIKSIPEKGSAWGSKKFSLGIQEDKMKYSKNEKEKYEKISISASLSQVLIEYFTIGLDYSKNTYLPQGASTIAAFKNKTISDENISDTVDALSDSSMGAYLEYNDLSFWSLGIGYSQSKDLQDKKDVTKSMDAYVDIEVGDNLTISPSYSITRSKTSSTPKVTTSALNLSFGF